MGERYFELWREVYANCSISHVFAAVASELRAPGRVNRLLLEIKEKLREADALLKDGHESIDLHRAVQLWDERNHPWVVTARASVGEDAARWFDDSWYPDEMVRLRLAVAEIQRACDGAIATVAKPAAALGSQALLKAPRFARVDPSPVGRTALAKAVLERAPEIVTAGKAWSPSAWAYMSIGVELEKPCRSPDEFSRHRVPLWKTALSRASTAGVLLKAKE